MAQSRKSSRMKSARGTGTSNGVRPPKSASVPFGDAELRATIAGQLLRRCAESVKVTVAGGFVALQGSVPTFREKERLHRFVMGLRGVKALKDLLIIEPVETLEDERISLLVRQALDAHSELPHGTAVVHVNRGTCTLNGHVRSCEERFIAEQIASHCRGVKKVKNELTVDPLDEVSDEATSRVVKSALAYCEDFETEAVSVSCADGLVLLRGQVPSLLDRALAEEVARLQPGVRRVENHIQVAHTNGQAQAGAEPVAKPARSSRLKKVSARLAP
jgi:osmotically-inducible protein OsmY